MSKKNRGQNSHREKYYTLLTNIAYQKQSNVVDFYNADF